MNKTNRKNIVDIVYSQISNVIELRTYGDDDYIVCICKEKDEELVYRTLAIIPRENVKYILTKEL